MGVDIILFGWRHTGRLALRAALAAAVIVASTMVFVEELVVTALVLATFYMCLLTAVRERFSLRRQRASSSDG